MTLHEFEQFCMLHQGGMFTVAQQVLNDMQSAEAAVLEAFTRMCRVHVRLSFRESADGRLFALLAVQSVSTHLMFRREALHGAPPCPAPILFPEMEEKAMPSICGLFNEARAITRLRAMGLDDKVISTVLNLDSVALEF